MSGNFAAIALQMQKYFDGLYHGDTGLLGQVFHPQARYLCATVEPLVNLSMDEYLPVVDARPAPASRGEQRRDSVVSIEFAGPKTAVVRAHCAIGPRYFTDLLTFIETEGEWRIIAKVFHYDIEPQTAS